MEISWNYTSKSKSGSSFSDWKVTGVGLFKPFEGLLRFSTLFMLFFDKISGLFWYFSSSAMKNNLQRESISMHVYLSVNMENNW